MGMKKITTNNGTKHSFQLVIFGLLICDVQRHNIHLIILNIFICNIIIAAKYIS